MSKPNKNKLFRVDATISYLIYTGKDKYTVKDFLAWAKNDMHTGELDESSSLNIKEVKSTEQIQDYIDREYDYSTYTDNTDEEIYLSPLISELGLDAEVLADRLRELGYLVSAPDAVKSKSKKTKHENI
jgi:hypothetical protein